MSSPAVSARLEALKVRGPGAALAILPGALIVYLAFRSGGYFAGDSAAGSIVLILALVIRFASTARPAQGVTKSLLVAAAALALFAGWTLLSARWSDAPSRALVEGTRPLLYLVALLFFGFAGGDNWRLRWLLRAVALAAVVVCGIAAITRLRPDIWPIDAVSISPRLSYPVTYWNTLGLLAALGMVFCVGLTSDERESRVVRVIAAAVVPVLACTLLLTLSRGGIAAAILGLLVVVVVGHPRGLFGGLVAVLPTTAIALVSTYNANLLVTTGATTAAGHAQGHHVAKVVVACMIAAAVVRGVMVLVDDRLSAIEIDPAARRRILGAGGIAVAVTLAIAAIAINVPRQYHRFVNNNNSGLTKTSDPRTRLTDPANNRRIQQWRVAVDQYKAKPLKGRGAGTYELSWDQRRPNAGTVRDAHSLYVEVLGELGLVGFALLVITLLTILIAVARRARGPDRMLYATIFAALVAWAAAAGIDWHWEMPVVTLWFFVLGGAAISAPTDGVVAHRFLAVPPRMLVAAGLCVVMVLIPIRVGYSQARLQSATQALYRGDCDRAKSLAHKSLDALGTRPQPYVILASCESSANDNAAAIVDMQNAAIREPGNAVIRYGLAVARAREGKDPRKAAARALRADPQDKLIQTAVKRFDAAHDPTGWRRISRGLGIRVPPP